MLSFTDKKQLISWILIALTLAFIFLHSLMSHEVSSNESDAVSVVVTDVVVGVIGNETPAQIEKSEKATKFIDENMRKIAHFVEFSILGAEIALLGFFVASDKAKKDTKVARASILILSLVFGLAVAFLDESLQMLSNRGPSIRDMWIDIGGFCALMLPVHLIVFAAKKNKLSTR